MNKRDMTRVMALFVFLIIDISQHVERLHLRKSWKMKPVILDDDVEQAVALLPGHPEEMHRGIIHAHHQ